MPATRPDAAATARSGFGEPVNGTFIRRSARTHLWEEAEELRLRLLQAVTLPALPAPQADEPSPPTTPFALQLPPVQPHPVEEALPPAPKRPRVTIKKAVESYLADAVIVINPAQVTPLHLQPEFESVIRMPEEVTSVILRSPGTFKAEHKEGEPTYVYVKPTTKEPSQLNLLIAAKSGFHVTIELISDGTNNASDKQPVDFLLEYRLPRSFSGRRRTHCPFAPKDSERVTLFETIPFWR